MGNPSNGVKFYARPAVLEWLKSQSGTTAAINDVIEAHIGAENLHQEQQTEILELVKKISNAIESGIALVSAEQDDQDEDLEMKNKIKSMF